MNICIFKSLHRIRICTKKFVWHIIMYIIIIIHTIQPSHSLCILLYHYVYYYHSYIIIIIRFYIYSKKNSRSACSTYSNFFNWSIQFFFPVVRLFDLYAFFPMIPFFPMMLAFFQILVEAWMLWKPKVATVH